MNGAALFMVQKQVKSKKRVADHGEVFTADREVNAMLDLVKTETERIDSRFLEPACGNGNFLAEIMRRKLAAVKKQYGKNPADFEKYAVMAATSVYGVDILEDNVKECRRRIFNIWNKSYTANCREEANEPCRIAVKYILKRNILWGNALDMKMTDGKPIIFSEWSFVTGNLVKRRDFRLDVLMKEQGKEDTRNDQMCLASYEVNADNEVNWEYDPEARSAIPKPIREFPLTDYREVQRYE